jgi:hypothetical protein
VENRFDATLEIWGRVFTSDGTTENSGIGAPVGSYEEQLVWMHELAVESFETGQHMMSLPVITLGGDTAEARTDFLTLQKFKPDKNKGGSAVLIAPGAFHDKFVRTPDGWRIKHRRYEVYFGEKVPAVPNELFEVKP